MNECTFHCCSEVWKHAQLIIFLWYWYSISMCNVVPSFEYFNGVGNFWYFAASSPQQLCGNAVEFLIFMTVHSPVVIFRTFNVRRCNVTMNYFSRPNLWQDSGYDFLLYFSYFRYKFSLLSLFPKC